MTATTSLSLHDQCAQRLMHLKADFYAKTHAAGEAVADGPGALTGAMLDAITAAGDAVDAACEEFRREFYPRAGRVVAARDEVYTVSPQGRNMRKVWTR